jgi:hypothetical protein
MSENLMLQIATSDEKGVPVCFCRNETMDRVNDMYLLMNIHVDIHGGVGRQIILHSGGV